MLADKYRLRDDKTIEYVKKNGKKLESKSFRILYSPNKKELKDKEPATKFCIIVSTNIHKNASMRNRAKRSLREGIRQNLYRMQDGLNVVVIGKKGIPEMYTNVIMQELNDTLDDSPLVK